MKNANAPNAPAEANETVSDLVIGTVANLSDTDPTMLPQPLYEVVDPDLLDALFGSATQTPSRERASITFTYCGYEVTVYGNESVVVRDPRAQRA